MVIVAIAVICVVGILATVFVLGSKYQQELFEDYMEDSQSTEKRLQSYPNLPTFKVP